MSSALPPHLPDARFLHGIDLFNRGEFFAAHEVWEDLWRESSGDARQFYQGLIQCAVALEHARRGNVRGALRMAERYPRRFAGLPPVFMGIDLGGLLGQMRRVMVGLREAGRRGAAGPPIILRIEPTPT